MELIDETLLNRVTQEAKESQRLRKNYNFHKELEAPSQRLLNAVEPGTVLPIHRHPQTSETYVVLRGRVRVLIYDDDRNIVQDVVLSPQSGRYGGHSPAGQWHTIEVLESGSVIFECKDGPYIPVTPENTLL